MRAALVSNGIVENVIVYDPEGSYLPGEGFTVIVLNEGDLVGPGWTYDGNVFAPPPPSGD